MDDSQLKTSIFLRVQVDAVSGQFNASQLDADSFSHI